MISVDPTDGTDQTMDQMMQRPTRTDDGFTLVELMIAVALLGMVMAVIFSLFATTSDSLYEADSLADTLDRARFGIERISGDLRSAGAYASPDSSTDPWVEPKLIGANAQLQVFGVASYNGWQNDDSLFSTEIQEAHTVSGGLTNDDAPGTSGSTNSGSAISFDGFIVMGAIDYPQTFEVAGVDFNPEGQAEGGWIPETERGLYKLLANDPFYVRLGEPEGVSMDVQDDVGADELITRDMQNRLLRIMDRNGYVQMSGVAFDPLPSYTEDESGTIPSGFGIEFGLRSPLAVQQSSGDGEIEYGLERDTEDDEDIGYDAALIDAYWYYVDVDPEDPVNYRLIRERLDAHALGLVLNNPAAIDRDALSDSLAAKAHNSGGVTSRDRVIIVDRVVDFQVWFDCANANGNIESTDWQMRWANPTGDSGGGCMTPASPANFGSARVAHVRLSVRTANERSDAPEAPEAFFMDEAGNTNALVPLRYFNKDPDAKGSTRVITVQTDVELANFALRNL